jgi:cell division transport system permease protein
MSLGLHHNIIEILHIVGAKDTYVAQQYAKRMAFLGFLGGLFGLFLAIPAIFFIGKLAAAIEGGIINDASLELVDWAAVFALPVFSMLIAMLTAYYTVKRTLKKLL